MKRYLECKAKINLALEVVSKNDSGYHTLNTLICILEDYSDFLTIEKANKFSVETQGNYAFKGENILTKVAELFKEEFGGEINFKIIIQKNIKTGAGLGGGSSNAACFLHFLLKYNDIFLSKKKFSEFGLKLGADVPFFYDNTPKICTHYGEVLNAPPFCIPYNLYALVILPNFEINTKMAFSLLNPADFKPNSSFQTFNDVLIAENSFEKVAMQINNEIKEIIDKLKLCTGMLKAGLSGSGSACFALFKTEEEAINASKNNWQYEVVISKLTQSRFF